MLRALIRKQLLELTAFLFQNKKDGKRYPATKIVLLSLLMVICFVSCAMGFVGINLLFGDTLLNRGADWLYLSMAGFSALLFGVIGSVLTTYNTLYRAKDNDLLLSMPIPAGKILATRLLTVYITGLVFTAMSWIPAVIIYGVLAHPGAGVILADIALMFVINLAATAIGCILGWLVALIVARFHNKYVGVVALLVFLFGFYYLIYFRMNDLLQEILNKMDMFRELFETKLYPFYELGLGASGNIPAMLVSTGIAVALFSAVYFILSKTFFRIVSIKRGEKKKIYVEKTAKQSKVSSALFRKELKRWTGSMAYMINTGIGLVMMLVAAVLLLIKQNELTDILGQITSMIPWLGTLIPFFGALMLCLLNSMNMISAPSVSLEGKMLWVLRSSPVDTKDVLTAKQKLHIVLCMPPALILSAAMILVLKPAPLTAVLIVLISMAAVMLNGAAGLALNLKMPNLVWTNETVPVKSGAPIAITMFGGWGICLALGVAGYFLRDSVSTEVCMGGTMLLMVLGTAFIHRWIYRCGVREWEDLTA